jgi:hypothetical protein
MQSGKSLRLMPEPGVVLGDATAVVPLLEEIEALPESATGALVFGQPSQGTVLVESGRICWAGAQGMEKRLTEMLRAYADEPPESKRIEEVYRRCKREQIPVVRALVESGLVSLDGLREVIRQHTSEALLALTREAPPEPPKWVAHRHQGYDAKFTFDPCELIVSVGAVCHPDLAGRARLEFEGLLRSGVTAVAFARPPGVNAPAPIWRSPGAYFAMRQVMSLGRWAFSALDVCNAYSARARIAATLVEPGEYLVAWQSRGIVSVAQCEDSMSFAFIVGKRARATS